jgi:transcriptional regulator with XRE-family HTH domain
MSTSPTTVLSEPTGTDKVPRWTCTYFRARLKQRIYNLLIGEFKRSKLSQADLSRRLDMEPAQLSRILSGPGNLTLETVSDVLFAISGAELGLSTDYPLAASTSKRIVSGLENQGAQVIPLYPRPTVPCTEVNPGLIESLQEQANASLLTAA